MWTALLVGGGLVLAAQSVIDPLRPAGSILGPLLVGLTVAITAWRGGSWQRLLFPAALAVTFGVSAHVPIEFRADSGPYFVYVRSVVFDRDLDFTNEWDKWEYDKGNPTRTGLVRNAQSVGPAIIWSPAYIATHMYLVTDQWLTGEERYRLDGYGRPYRRAAALTTLTMVVLGAALLIQVMVPMFGTRIAALAVLGTVLASPVLYYAFVVPTMAHGVTFGAAALFIWAWDRVRQQPSLQTWTVLGVTLGVVTISRWQGALYGLMVIPLAVRGLTTKTLKPVWLAAFAGAGLVVFSPQLLAWKILFDRWLTIPQGRGFLSFSSPHLLEPLFSANHGFFNWTPVMFLGFIGLLVGLRRSRLLYGGSLLVFVATAWVNGSVPGYDWAAGDAFGGRRFSLVVPLMSLGLGALLELVAKILARRPLLVPSAALLLLFLWNVGLISQYRARKYRGAAPLEQIAADQARTFRLVGQDLFGWVAGERGRAWAYEIFSAEYFYTRFNRSGTIDLRSAGKQYLLEGWGAGSRRKAERTFRRALYPRACVRVPLQGPVDLKTVVTARAPSDLSSQTVAVILNGQVLTTAPLSNQWDEIEFTMPARELVRGENSLCLRFSEALPAGERGDERVAAFVERIQLP